MDSKLEIFGEEFLIVSLTFFCDCTCLVAKSADQLEATYDTATCGTWGAIFSEAGEFDDLGLSYL
jgi:hypothetical protein